MPVRRRTTSTSWCSASPTTNGPGQHEALGRYLRAVFDKPPADRAARELDRLRRARNQDGYEAQPMGAAATEKAEQVARTLFDAAAWSWGKAGQRRTAARGVSQPVQPAGWQPAGLPSTESTATWSARAR